jgi:hypothetical protein
LKPYDYRCVWLRWNLYAEMTAKNHFIEIPTITWYYKSGKILYTEDHILKGNHKFFSKII